jgi:TRAP-type C4-dicarboxylate transport system permease small subunit
MWLFLVAILLSGYEVAMRYAFNAPSTWIHVTTTALCAVAFAFGGAWCMARREHIRVDFFPERAGPRSRRVIETASLLVGLFYLGGLGYGLCLDASGSFWRFDFQGRWTPELTPGPPNWPLPTIIKASLLAGCALFALVCLAQLVRALRPAAKG